MGRFSQDIRRYQQRGYSTLSLWLEPAVWAIASYRFSNWVYTGKPPALLKLPLKIVSLLAVKFCVVVMEMDLDPQATIGGGLYIGHIGGVHINPGAILGENCDIGHRVTIGASAMGRSGVPVIGDGVYIGTGAVVVGKIKIASGAKIAANSLVMTNVPAGATVMGVPARVVMRPKAPANTPVATAEQVPLEQA